MCVSASKGMPPYRRVPSPCVSHREVMPPCPRAANRSRTRSVPTGPRSSWPPATGHYPLPTIHCSPAVPQSRPALPCGRFRNVLYCKVEPEHNQAGPERAASAKMPAHHARAGNHIDLPKYERSKPANKAVRSTSYRYRREMRQLAIPRAAHPQRNETRHADNAEAADFQFCILSQGECNHSHFAPSYHTNAFLLHDPTTKLRKIRPRPYPVTKVQANILSREAQKNFKNSATLGTFVHFDTL